MRAANGAMMPVRRAAVGLATMAILALVATVTGYSPAVAEVTSTEQLNYKVHHSVFGDIGTYTNTVQKAGDAATVRTTAHFLVSVLGIGMHREDAVRTERWQHGRLISFNGTTKKNDDVIEVKGEASGDYFMIRSPLGMFSAPATVQPANPWSASCLKSTTMMRVDTGKIEQVRIGGGQADTVTIDGAKIPAHEYQISGSTRYKIWFDQQNVPVMFVVDDDSGEVTFTLQR